MRTIIAATFLLALAACGESRATDQEIRNDLRISSLNDCESDAREELTRTRQWSDSSAGDIRRICGCIVDQSMQGASTDDLVARSVGTGQGDAELTEQERVFALCQDQFQRTEAAAVAQRTERQKNDPDAQPGRRSDPGASLRERQQRDLDRIQER